MIARLEAGARPRGAWPNSTWPRSSRGVAELYEALAEEAGVSLDLAVEDGLPRSTAAASFWDRRWRAFSTTP